MENYIRIRQIGGDDYEVLGWRTSLACEWWSLLKRVSGHDICKLMALGVAIIEV